MQQNAEIPFIELVPLQFRITPEFVKAFKQAAFDGETKLNELLKECFET